MIWINQHPPDCSRAKYLLAGSWYQGFGSETHVLGMGLAIAMATNRVLLQDPRDSRTWRIDIKFCRQQNKTNSECYYVPWSNCTLDDAYATLNNARTTPKPRFNKDTLKQPFSKAEDRLLIDQVVANNGPHGQFETIQRNHFPNKSDSQLFYRWKTTLFQQWKGEEDVRRRNMSHGRRFDPMFDMHRIEQSFRRSNALSDRMTPYGVLTITRAGNIKFFTQNGTLLIPTTNDSPVIALDVGNMLGERKFVPRPFHPILACSPILPGFEHFWWRSIAAAYLLRPNAVTLKKIDELTTQTIRQSNGMCIATYVRHGDKGSEMKFVDFKRYVQTAEYIYDKHLLTGKHANDSKIFYVGSEDNAVFQQATKWGRAKNVTVVSMPIATTVLKRKAAGVNHQLEYLSYLVNIAEITRCQVLICTYLSNYCRVLDEMRATVGAKANRLIADVNLEICPEGRMCVAVNSLLNINEYSIDARIW